MMTWTDFERTSVLNLDGSDAERNPYAVPRLVVALEEDRRWRGFAVTETQPLLEFAERAEGRSQAKRALVSAILQSLKDDAARPGHSELMAVQPHLEALHALVF